MKILYGASPTSLVLRVKLMDSTSTTGAGLTGLAYNSSGLKISTIQIGEASATAYTAAGSTIETITTLGTFATPTATKCRFKEVDATNHPGVYELQFANARFASTNSVIISILGATNLVEADFEIQCDIPAIESTISFVQLLRIILAFAAGKADGGGSTTLHFRDVADSKNRITATVDSSGNRSAITTDGT